MSRASSGLAYLGALGLLGAVACGPPPSPQLGGGGGRGEGLSSPLGPSYVLVPLPSDDDSVLGRILPSEPEPGRSLEETARANPCADKLTEAKTSPMASSFEDAQDLQVHGKARAMLGAFGFSGDAERATHFVYKLEASKRISKQDTAEYTSCCAQKGCGYGYVSALVYGEGEYATGEESAANASVDVLTVGGASGGARVKVLHKRKVKGWLAAVVTVTDPSKGQALGPLGVAQAAGITEASIPATVKSIYDREKVEIKTAGASYVLSDAKTGEVKENEFVRRFRGVTGSNELDLYERRRNPFAFYTSGALTAISAGVAVYGFLNLTRPCDKSDVDPDGSFVSSDCQATNNKSPFGINNTFDPNATRENGLGIAMAIGGTAGFVGFGAWFLYLLFKTDGGADEHYLSEHDATLYVTRYNRALLRRTIKDVQKTQSRWVPTLRMEPTVGLGFTGLRGTF